MKHKYYIIALVIISALGVGNHYYQKSEKNRFIDKVKKDIEKEKNLVIDKIIKENDSLNTEVTNLIISNEKAVSNSKYWYNQAKKRNINPDYNLDFLSAADIIAKSKYRSGKRDSIIRPESNN